MQNEKDYKPLVKKLCTVKKVLPATFTTLDFCDQITTTLKQLTEKHLKSAHS